MDGRGRGPQSVERLRLHRRPGGRSGCGARGQHRGCDPGERHTGAGAGARRHDAGPRPGRILKAYQAGQYKQAEAQLNAALKAGLNTPADQVAAHKHLAFIYCTSKRDTMCATEFKAAKASDPAFALSKAEAGHPMWARTYKRALGLK